MADKNTATTTELKPCPFCGGDAKPLNGWMTCEVYCTVCGARTFIVHNTVQDAIDHWNRRVSDG